MTVLFSVLLLLQIIYHLEGIMKLVNIIIVILCTFIFAFGCKKDMSLQTYAKIDLEVASSDQKPKTIDEIAKKYGASLKQYQEMTKKIEKDKKLKQKLGEIRLKELNLMNTNKDSKDDKKDNKKKKMKK